MVPFPQKKLISQRHINALFVIDGCPAEDRRAKEALRIAAGISPWGKVRPTICFTHSLGQALGQADDPEIGRYLKLLRETSGGLFTLAKSGVDWLRQIDQAGLAKLEADTDTVLRF
jgi:hypothetical protein